MEYIITFSEGLISFIAPCMLPMIPVYLSFLAGNSRKKSTVFLNSFFFVIGFSAVFLAYGFFAGTLGSFFSKCETALNIISGSIVILFGLSYLDVIHIPFLKAHFHTEKMKGTFSSFIFGLVFSISHTPCLSAFLGSAIMTATSSQTAKSGVLLLLAYSLGMGIPFLLSAGLIEKLTKLFDTIKRNYKTINTVCGIFLIVVGVAMMFGLLHDFIHILEGGHTH